MAGDAPSYFSISEAAARLGVSRMTIWRWVRAGRLPVARLGHRTARIRLEDLDRMMDGTRAGIVQGSDRSARSAGRQIGPVEHLVQFYEVDAALVEAVSEYIGAGLRAGDRVVAIASAAHRAAVDERLRGDGLDLNSARASGDYVELEAVDTLGQIMADGQPDPHRFAEVVGTVIARAADGRRSVRAFGEMVALLAAQGDHAAAVQLESLFGGEAFATVFGDVCAEHSLVVPAESYTALPADAQAREIARLQHRAASLEAEVAARERLEIAALRLAAIVASSDDAIIGKTLEGTIVDWNIGAERLYGYTATEVIGRPISVLIPEDRPDELPAIIERLKLGERIDHYETERITKDGRRVSVSVSISPIRNAAGRLVGASAIARDISERRRNELEREELLARERQSRGEAEAALRLRDEFLSIASHELRTPLATLNGYAQLALRRLARDGQFDPARVVEALQAITGQADKLNSLLNQLLDISRLELGKLALEPRRTDVVALVEQVVVGARARDGAHTIALTGLQSQEAEVDPLRLEQVLTNLLDNAMKYSPEGGPIEVVVSRTADHALDISIRDHGLGIPPEKRARIFERFYQAHGNGHKSGMGLGLYVSRDIVELHGGEITAEFPADGGSRFVVRLPLTRSLGG